MSDVAFMRSVARDQGKVRYTIFLTIKTTNTERKQLHRCKLKEYDLIRGHVTDNCSLASRNRIVGTTSGGNPMIKEHIC